VRTVVSFQKRFELVWGSFLIAFGLLFTRINFIVIEIDSLE